MNQDALGETMVVGIIRFGVASGTADEDSPDQFATRYEGTETKEDANDTEPSGQLIGVVRGGFQVR